MATLFMMHSMIGFLGRRGQITRPLRAPDLMPQLFPVGLCQKCHAECTRQAANLGEPKQWITTAVEAVTPEMLRLVWAEVSYWLDMLSHE